MEAAMQQNLYTISIPKIDTKRFRGIVKAMGWVIIPQPTEESFDITQTAGFKEAMDDVKHGRVTHYASAKDMFEKLQIEV